MRGHPRVAPFVGLSMAGYRSAPVSSATVVRVGGVSTKVATATMATAIAIATAMPVSFFNMLFSHTPPSFPGPGVRPNHSKAVGLGEEITYTGNAETAARR